MYKRIKNGFTLAEVLITLGVIGVVAAITMPTLIQKHKEQVTINKVKKFYSTISQAYESYVDEYGYPDTMDTFNTQEEATTYFATKIKSYLKILKDCGYDEGCFINDNYKRASGLNTVNFITDANKRYMAVLNDGSAVAFFVDETGKGGVFYYDVNGIQPPNQFGRDIFQISFDSSHKLLPGEHTEDNTEVLTNCLDKGFTCAHWLIANGNMDYLHCPDYLTENPTATKCSK